MLDDLYALRDRARVAASRGDLETATLALLAAAGQTHVAEHEYVAVLKPLHDVLARRGDARAAMTVIGYLAAGDPGAWKRAAPLLPRVPPVDRALALAAQGRMSDAASEMEAAGKIGAAAILREKAKEWPAARELWSRLARVTERDTDAYVAALVRLNLARCARQCGDPGEARRAIVAAVRLLEEAADHFESVGQRERAFDCFQVLIQVGRESGAFEDVLEGFVNCVRILREDHLKYFALEYLEDAIAAALERGETAAAATLAREASEYARSLGMAAAAAGYCARQGDLWRALARLHLDRGAPAEIAENALLSAVLAFGEVGRYSKVGEVYRELAALALEPSRQEHYARAVSRYAGVADDVIPAGPGASTGPHHDTHSVEVWHVDVIEWEQRGSAAEACADVLLDKRWPDLIRRKAMLARLTALAVEALPAGPAAAALPTYDPGPRSIDARARLAEQLGQLTLYAVLSPLERLFDTPDRAVRLGVLRALQTLFFKRSFVAVRAALRDPDPAVVEQAIKAVEALSFPHAVDPLSRILRESPQPAARAAALRALAGVDSPEAIEMLVGMIEHGAGVDRDAALAALRMARGPQLVAVARARLPGASEELAGALRGVLAARGLEV